MPIPSTIFKNHEHHDLAHHLTLVHQCVNTVLSPTRLKRFTAKWVSEHPHEQAMVNAWYDYALDSLNQHLSNAGLASRRYGINTDALTDSQKHYRDRTIGQVTDALESLAQHYHIKVRQRDQQRVLKSVSIAEHIRLTKITFPLKHPNQPDLPGLFEIEQVLRGLSLFSLAKQYALRTLPLPECLCPIQDWVLSRDPTQLPVRYPYDLVQDAVAFTQFPYERFITCYMPDNYVASLLMNDSPEHAFIPTHASERQYHKQFDLTPHATTTATTTTTTTTTTGDASPREIQEVAEALALILEEAIEQALEQSS